MARSRQTGTIIGGWSLLRGTVGVSAILAGGLVAGAQTFSASITGIATDNSGAVVPGAKVDLMNVDTKDVREKVTGNSGAYDFQNLLPGTYKLTVSANGFKDSVKTGLVLRANTAASVDTMLQIGNAQEQVVVSADTVLVDTETPNNSVTMDSVLIENLPNSTRNPLNFVFDLAGTTESQGETSRSSTFDQQASAFGINGGREAESEILIDGAPSTALDWGGLFVAPIQDSVQEQQVVQNEYDAQYDRGGEGVVTLVTKSGSDHFHGEVYDYFRNSALDANTWSNGYLGGAKPLFHRNQFGANLGGPIWRKHNLHFFGGYEGLRQPGSLGFIQTTVPTVAERSGDFSQAYLPSGALATIYNPFTTHQVTDAKGNTFYTRDPFPGNVIPSGFDPVGQKILSLYPLPNRPGTGPDQENNFVGTGSNNTENDKFDARIDWAQSPKHRIFGRVSDRVRENNTPGCVFCNGDDNTPNNNDHAIQAAVNDTLTPTQNWVIDIYGAYSRWWEGQSSIGLGVANLSNIGLSPSLSQADLLPAVSAGEYAYLGAYYSSFNRYVRYSSTGILNFTRELHSHTLKFGFNYDVAMINIRADSPLSLNFSNDQTSCDAGPVAGDPCQVLIGNNLSGHPIASMELGVGSGGSSNFNLDPAMSQHAFGLYLQDNWRATPRLTVYAGLRYENQRPGTERHNRAAYFDTKAVNSFSTTLGSTVNGAFEYVGIDGRSRDLWEPDNLNFSPRLGLAYKLDNRTVIRAGAGIYYAPTSAMLGYDSPGQFPGFTAQTNWEATQNSQGYIPQNLVSNPFPDGLQQPTGTSQGDQTLLGVGAGQVWVKGPHPTGALYQWSTDIQYQVSNHSVAEIGYTGVRGRRLLYGNPNLDIDQLPTADLAMGPALHGQVANPYQGLLPASNFLNGPTVDLNTLLRPYPAFGYIQETRSTPGARSQFDALYIKYNHSYNNGLSTITTYQWSKNLDNGSDARLGWLGTDGWRDATNTKLDYSLSAHDQPQSFAEALVYQLPYGAGRHWGNTAPQFIKQTIGGWNSSVAVHLGDGLPLISPVTFGNNPLSNYGFPGSGLPDVIGNPQPRHRTRTNWINVAAFNGSDGSDSLTPATVNCGTSLPGSTTPACQPFAYRYGDEPNHMTQLREADNDNLDVGLGKEFGGERIHTEFRADFLNVLNHPIYGGSYFNGGNIVTNINSSQFGQVTGTRNDPRNIQLSLKISY